MLIRNIKVILNVRFLNIISKKEMNPGPIALFANGDPFGISQPKRLENDILEFTVSTPDAIVKMKIDGDGNLFM